MFCRLHGRYFTLVITLGKVKVFLNLFTYFIYFYGIDLHCYFQDVVLYSYQVFSI